MTKLLHWITLFLLLTNNLYSQQVEINYFEESPPGKDPKVFAPGFICKDNRIEGRGAFSPDGKQFYFTISNISFKKQKILYTEFKNNQWTKPDTAVFSKKYANYEPFFSSDGQKLFFTSNRNPDTLGNRKDIYFVRRIGDSWSEPEIVDRPINSQHTEVFFSQVKNGNIYFSSDRAKGKGLYKIYMALKQPNDSFIVKNIGKRINKHYWDADPCIAPYESFIIFSVVRMLKFFHKTDLYITFKDGNKWTKPKSLGKLINTTANEYAPFLSPDNKYLFFTRLGKGNMGDIYWVDLSEIMKLKRNK